MLAIVTLVTTALARTDSTPIKVISVLCSWLPMSYTTPWVCGCDPRKPRYTCTVQKAATRCWILAFVCCPIIFQECVVAFVVTEKIANWQICQSCTTALIKKQAWGMYRQHYENEYLVTIVPVTWMNTCVTSAYISRKGGEGSCGVKYTDDLTRPLCP